MEENTQAQPKSQGNGLLIGLLAVIVILVGVVVYLALSKPIEIEDLSLERETVVTEVETEEEPTTEEEEITSDEEAADESTEEDLPAQAGTDEGEAPETVDIDSDLQDLDELNLGDIEDQYSDNELDELE